MWLEHPNIREVLQQRLRQMQHYQQTLAELRSLSSTGWLSNESLAFQARIANAGRWVVLTRGKLLYAVGDEPTAIFGLEQGQLDISIPISEDEQVTVHRTTPGFWIGDGALLAQVPRQLTVTAAVDSRLFKVPAGAIHKILAEHPEDWSCFYRLAALNATLCVHVLAETLALPPRARFARTLLRMISDDGRIRVTQEELGRMVGMSRAAFRRAFRALIEAGIIETEYGYLRVRDLSALKKAAEHH